MLLPFQSTLPARGATRENGRGSGGKVISIHAPRTGSDDTTAPALPMLLPFQSTLPARGATAGGGVFRRARVISIHAPRTGSDRAAGEAFFRHLQISIHAPRTGSDAAGITPRRPRLISIHAPRTGSDAFAASFSCFSFYFNPRSPHGERRAARLAVLDAFAFQSTLPARGATRCAPCGSGCFRISIHAPRTGSDGGCALYYNQDIAISIHAPRTGSDVECIYRHWMARISIHAPRTGSDELRRVKGGSRNPFQSTLPARGATISLCLGVVMSRISIHAPRTGSDAKMSSVERTISISIHAPRTGSDGTTRRSKSQSTHFNPRSPHGERQVGARSGNGIENFNPRSPHGERPPPSPPQTTMAGISIHAPRTGSDSLELVSCQGVCISIHAPRTGSDPWSRRVSVTRSPFQSTLPARGATTSAAIAANCTRYFNPRSPHGERPSSAPSTAPESSISIHAPRTGSDEDKYVMQAMHYISIHAPRTGSDLYVGSHSAAYSAFQSTLPARGATGIRSMVIFAASHFNPRSPHGERPVSLCTASRSPAISIHAPRTGSDAADLCCGFIRHAISIHAPRTGSDVVRVRGTVVRIFQSTLPARGATGIRSMVIFAASHFNPRSPHGERLMSTSASYSIVAFQSTLPARGATQT